MQMQLAHVSAVHSDPFALVVDKPWPALRTPPPWPREVDRNWTAYVYLVSRAYLAFAGRVTVAGTSPILAITSVPCPVPLTQIACWPLPVWRTASVHPDITPYWTTQTNNLVWQDVRLAITLDWSAAGALRTRHRKRMHQNPYMRSPSHCFMAGLGIYFRGGIHAKTPCCTI